VLVTAVASQTELRALTAGVTILSRRTEHQCLLLSCRADFRDVQLVCTGVGPAKAAAGAGLIARQANCREVVLLGAAGALDPCLRVGDIVVADAVVNMSGERIALTTPFSKNIYSCLCAAGMPAQAGTVLGGGRFVHKKAEKASLHRTSGARTVDMESMAFVRLLSRMNIPLCVIRVISDTAHRDVIDIASLVRTKNRSGLPGVARHLLWHPSEMLRGAQLFCSLKRVTRTMRALFHTILRDRHPAST
jgi:nucleoside phosphorylase